jgi:hypothetical protein
MDQEDDVGTDSMHKSAKESNHSTAKREIPNGGTLAWLQVLGAFCLYINTW